MEIERQKTRFFPLKGTNYFDLNTTLSEYLLEIKPLLEGKKIIDIGAGEIPFQDYYKDLDVTTCDIQNNSTNTIDHIIIPDSILPFENSSFDVILVFDVLEHIKNDLFFLSECNRILTNDGILVASIPFMYRYHEIPYDFRRYTPSGLKYVLEESKFQLITLKNIGSVIFSAETILLEHQVEILPFFRKLILKIILVLLKAIRKRSEISQVAPFAFFFVAKKQ
ncbi:class I SAM-dependent methyltransferase [Cytophagaceae bacterium 50A-KIRBA]|uniref:class I SAM-dependent methyltransferase n=1 Tax=Aquirufa ecclesiirivi TaxID=2715124 RepID=UPI00140A5075|nr:methyltransferase domain-containing protein [Aquirufa ecclesiirivi]NHC48152.1 class I SAM-dependent methyltransferase [Aquirufa ecclesiirivi]